MFHTADAAENTGQARSAYLANKSSQQYNSKAKSLLYGGEEKPNTPLHHGKRSVPHAGQHNAAPFAVWDGHALAGVETVQGGQVSKTYQARNTKKEGAGKISSTVHDADAYRNQLIANATNLANQKTKARGSLGAHQQQTPGTAPPATAHSSAGGHHPQELLDDQEGLYEEQQPAPVPDHHYRY